MRKGAGSFQAKHPRSNPAQGKGYVVHVRPRVLAIVWTCRFSARSGSGPAGSNLIRARGRPQIGYRADRHSGQLKKCTARHGRIAVAVRFHESKEFDGISVRFMNGAQKRANRKIEAKQSDLIMIS